MSIPLKELIERHAGKFNFVCHWQATYHKINKFKVTLDYSYDILQIYDQFYPLNNDWKGVSTTKFENRTSPVQ